MYTAVYSNMLRAFCTRDSHCMLDLRLGNPAHKLVGGNIWKVADEATLVRATVVLDDEMMT
jgi:hypothetical protein